MVAQSLHRTAVAAHSKPFLPLPFASHRYELEYMEREGRMRRGHKVWQIAFGSGFKCNSAVWRALKTVPASSTDY